MNESFFTIFQGSLHLNTLLGAGLVSSSLVSNLVPMDFNYWSPAIEHPSSTSTLFTDGGFSQDHGLIPLLQRGVKKIFVVTATPNTINFESLRNYDSPDNWKNAKKMKERVFDNMTPSYFGIAEDVKENDYDQNHVFRTSEFEGLVEGYYAAHLRGSGLIHRQMYTTVENTFYGIRADQNFDITFFNSQRCDSWDKLLPTEIYDLLYVNRPPKDTPGCFPGNASTMEFEHFPYFTTQIPCYTKSEANALANLASWVVIDNKDIIEDIFS